MNFILLLTNLLLLSQLTRASVLLNSSRILAEGLPGGSLSSSAPVGSQSGGISNVTPYTTDTNTAVQCNQQMMTSYGLEGYTTAQVQTHKYCPSITQNCCTAADETMSMQLWNNQYKYTIENYYETYLYSIKYILGYSQEVYKLAQEFKDADNATCKSAAMDFIGMNFNVQITQDVYKSFVTSLEKMGDVRRGFFCVLCDARTQEKLKDFWSSSNLFYHDRIYFSKDFCRKLVDQTIRASYFTIFYLKRFADNMGKLVNCKTGNSKVLEYEIPYTTSQQVKNCYYFKNKYFFFFCENYCEKFHLVKANAVLDGDLGELKKFVEHVMENRDAAFMSPSNNILMNGLGFEEDYLKDKYKTVFDDVIFFRASTNQVMLDTFKTDVVYYGGMDPWESCESSLYSLVLSSAGLAKAVIMGLIMLLTW